MVNSCYLLVGSVMWCLPVPGGSNVIRFISAGLGHRTREWKSLGTELPSLLLEERGVWFVLRRAHCLCADFKLSLKKWCGYINEAAMHWEVAVVSSINFLLKCNSYRRMHMSQARSLNFTHVASTQLKEQCNDPRNPPWAPLWGPAFSWLLTE